MKIEGSVALVTGANRGLGQAYAAGTGPPRRSQGLRGGPEIIEGHRARADASIQLDITDADRVAQVAQRCTDVAPLVSSNAAVLAYNNFTGAPDLSSARLEMETNFFGTLSMCRAFAPVLKVTAAARSSTCCR